MDWKNKGCRLKKELKYYIIKFDRGRESYIVPFAGAKGKCEAVYDILREKVRTDEE